MIDTHAHIYTKEFESDLRDMISRAQSIGVSKILMPNIDKESIPRLKELASSYPSYCYKMMGLHPCSVKKEYKKDLKEILKELDSDDYIAVGEIGIDLYWDQSTKDIQIDAFLEQCEWAIERDLPVAIHSRDSLDLNIELVRNNFDGKLQGVFHCFTGTLDQAKAIVNLGMYLGIGGVLTFKNSDIRQVLPYVPVENIVLETDSPYLAPMPNRGKRNEPAYLQSIHGYLADILGIKPEDLNTILDSNALKLFKI